ncbi:hypothetical protein BJ912DRAFT_927760 [Pholiota molesta]|nr:hypothetical protein BJ912DRAFT_927760 [Pholiota molesta]
MCAASHCLPCLSTVSRTHSCAASRHVIGTLFALANPLSDLGYILGDGQTGEGQAIKWSHFDPLKVSGSDDGYTAGGEAFDKFPFKFDRLKPRCHGVWVEWEIRQGCRYVGAQV